MGEFIALIKTLIATVASFDWTGFMISLAATWFLIEKVLKVVAKITPWKFDDDLIEVLDRFFGKFRR